MDAALAQRLEVNASAIRELLRSERIRYRNTTIDDRSLSIDAHLASMSHTDEVAVGGVTSGQIAEGETVTLLMLGAGAATAVGAVQPRSVGLAQSAWSKLLPSPASVTTRRRVPRPLRSTSTCRVALVPVILPLSNSFSPSPQT